MGKEERAKKPEDSPSDGRYISPSLFSLSFPPSPILSTCAGSVEKGWQSRGGRKREEGDCCSPKKRISGPDSSFFPPPSQLCTFRFHRNQLWKFAEECGVPHSNSTETSTLYTRSGLGYSLVALAAEESAEQFTSTITSSIGPCLFFLNCFPKGLRLLRTKLE